MKNKSNNNNKMINSFIKRFKKEFHKNKIISNKMKCNGCMIINQRIINKKKKSFYQVKILLNYKP